MLAISNPKRTINACNLFQWGPNMLAISNSKRTIYACNLFQQGPNMLAIIKILFSRDSSRNHSHVTLERFPTLQAYLVTIEKDCRHKQSDLDLRLQAYLVSFLSRLQAYLVPIIKIIATICYPALYGFIYIPDRMDLHIIFRL